MQSQRESLLAQVQTAISGYSNELCHSYGYFEKNYENAFKMFINQSERQLETASETEDSEEQQEICSDEGRQL